MKPILHLLLFSFFSLSTIVLSQEDNQTETQTASHSEQAKPRLHFTASDLASNKHLTSDKTLSFDVMETKHHVFIHNAKSRTTRGNVLLFHSQNENADHLLFIQPLAEQLAHLGWNVFIPNIAQADYPKPKNQHFQEIKKKTSLQKEQAGEELSDESKKTTTDDATPNKSGEDLSTTGSEEQNKKSENDTSAFFKTTEQYQKYFDQLCASIIDKTEITDQPMIIVANQNAAYWSLNCFEKVNKQTMAVFLQPRLPIGVKNDLKDKFSQRSNPYFSFQVSNDKNAPFQTAFRNGFWKSSVQRINTGTLSKYKIQKEDLTIAKMITGWFNKQKNNRDKL